MTSMKTCSILVLRYRIRHDIMLNKNIIAPERKSNEIQFNRSLSFELNTVPVEL